MKYNTHTLVDSFDLKFDSADPKNGSLYIACNNSLADILIGDLRTRALWLEGGASVIKEDQKDAYKAGLIFVAAEDYMSGDETLVLARFNHPKYPSDSSRWAEWIATADQLFGRTK
jgi:hypothetical protein